MSTAAAKRYTVEEYLARERESDVKHEFYDGEIFAMPRANEGHNLIVANLIGGLGDALREQPCRVYPCAMNVLCPTGLRAYPDVSVVGDAPQFEDDRREVLLNSLVVIEVLSESTERCDRGVKFQHYETIGSLQAYVLVSHSGSRIQHFARGPHPRQWVLMTADRPESTIEFPALRCALPLSEIYAKVVLASVKRGHVRELPM